MQGINIFPLVILQWGCEEKLCSLDMVSENVLAYPPTQKCHESSLNFYEENYKIERKD